MKKSILMNFAGAVAIAGTSGFVGHHFGNSNGFDNGFNKAVEKINKVAGAYKQECIDGKIFKTKTERSYKITKAKSLTNQGTGEVIEAPYYMVDKSGYTDITQVDGSCYYDTVSSGSSINGIPQPDINTLVFDECSEDGYRVRSYNLGRGRGGAELGGSCENIGKPKTPKI